MLDLIYLASPYSHSDKLVIKARFKITEFMTYHYMRQRQAILSPIVHCHQVATDYGLPTDFDYWKGFNEATIARCQLFRVLKLPDWHASKGVLGETKTAEENNVAVEYIEWEDILSAILQRVGQHNQLWQYAMFLEHAAPKRD